MLRAVSCSTGSTRLTAVSWLSLLIGMVKPTERVHLPRHTVSALLQLTEKAVRNELAPGVEHPGQAPKKELAKGQDKPRTGKAKKVEGLGR